MSDQTTRPPRPGSSVRYLFRQLDNLEITDSTVGFIVGVSDSNIWKYRTFQKRFSKEQIAKLERLVERLSASETPSL